MSLPSSCRRATSSSCGSTAVQTNSAATASFPARSAPSSLPDADEGSFVVARLRSSPLRATSAVCVRQPRLSLSALGQRGHLGTASRLRLPASTARWLPRPRSARVVHGDAQAIAGRRRAAWRRGAFRPSPSVRRGAVSATRLRSLGGATSSCAGVLSSAADSGQRAAIAAGSSRGARDRPCLRRQMR